MPLCAPSVCVCRPLQPLELLKYLSEIVVALVEQLPKTDSAAQLQLATQLQATEPLLLSTTTSGCGSGGGRSGSGESASGAHAGSKGSSAAAGTALAAGDRVTAGQSAPPSSSASSAAKAAAAAVSSSVSAQSDLLAKLAAAEAAEIDLKAKLALLQELGGSNVEAGAQPAGTAAVGAAASASAPGNGGRAAADRVVEASSDGMPAAAELAVPATRGDAAQLQAAAAAAVMATPGWDSAAAGATGFTGRVAQQVLGLQQHVSKAMQSLASLGGRSSSGSSKFDAAAAVAADEAHVLAAVGSGALTKASGHASAPGGSSGGAEAGSAFASASSGALLSTSASAVATGHPQGLAGAQCPAEQHRACLLREQLTKQRLGEGRLASLQAMLGPGRFATWVWQQQQLPWPCSVLPRSPALLAGACVLS